MKRWFVLLSLFALHTPFCFSQDTIKEKWMPLDKGIHNSFPSSFTNVSALFVYDTKLYAGGAFNRAGDKQCNHIAVWNGTVWDSLSTGMNGDVLALAVYNNELYAA